MFPAFKPLPIPPKVHDCTVLLIRKGRAPYILRCVAEIVTGNGWKTVYSRCRSGARSAFRRRNSAEWCQPALRLFELANARASRSRCLHHRKRGSQHHVSGCNAARIQLHSRPRSARVLPKVSRLSELLTKSGPRRKKSSSQDATTSRFRVIRAHARERGRNYSPVPQGRAFLSGRGLPFSGRHFSNTTREEARV